MFLAPDLALEVSSGGPSGSDRAWPDRPATTAINSSAQASTPSNIFNAAAYMLSIFFFFSLLSGDFVHTQTQPQTQARPMRALAVSLARVGTGADRHRRQHRRRLAHAHRSNHDGKNEHNEKSKHDEKNKTNEDDTNKKTSVKITTSSNIQIMITVRTITGRARMTMRTRTRLGQHGTAKYRLAPKLKPWLPLRRGSLVRRSPCTADPPPDAASIVSRSSCARSSISLSSAWGVLSR